MRNKYWSVMLVCVLLIGGIGQRLSGAGAVEAAAERIAEFDPARSIPAQARIFGASLLVAGNSLGAFPGRGKDYQLMRRRPDTESFAGIGRPICFSHWATNSSSQS